MASSARGQDEPNRALWLATRAGKMEPSCPLGTTRCIPNEKFPRKPLNKSFIDQVCSVKIYILLTKREGRTGRISARGLDSTDRAQRGPYKKDRGRIFSKYGPEQAWLIERLSMTFMANGKRQKWNFCRLSSVVNTVKWNYLYWLWIVGDVIPFLCALFTDWKKRTQNQKLSLPFAVCR